MNILYISALSSKRLISSIYETTGMNPGFAVQKFSRLIVRGLRENDVDIIAFSNPPITNKVDHRIWLNISNETEEGINYKYIPFINLPMFKHIFVFGYSFLYVTFWGMFHRNNKAIVCDVLSISVCMGALLASKITRIKSVAVVTDIYSLMVGNKSTGITRIAGLLQKWYSTSFTHYVLLTEAMNNLVNPHNRPYIVMEALCDNSGNINYNNEIHKTKPLTIMYAGGLQVEYGLKMLVDAFCTLPRKDIQLVIYGQGSYVDELKLVCERDKRIIYKGVALNEEIVRAEKEATLLVNPRFTTGEFTKYSFPSKNMEYMASGTPLLTTRLPGMPEEYEQYVFLFEEETLEGYANAINKTLSFPEDYLMKKGIDAQQFVYREKNNINQTRRMIKLIEK